jgi:hypothetical protein
MEETAQSIIQMGQQAVEAERIVLYSQNESISHFERNVFYVMAVSMLQ